jgi:hypothetical protein
MSASQASASRNARWRSIPPAPTRPGLAAAPPCRRGLLCRRRKRAPRGSRFRRAHHGRKRSSASFDVSSAIRVAVLANTARVPPIGSAIVGSAELPARSACTRRTASRPRSATSPSGAGRTRSSSPTSSGSVKVRPRSARESTTAAATCARSKPMTRSTSLRSIPATQRERWAARSIPRRGASSSAWGRALAEPSSSVPAEETWTGSPRVFSRSSASAIALRKTLPVQTKTTSNARSALSERALPRNRPAPRI